jgi:MarR family 2-MHQ and catechol resistance regulon transcriptional repressor
VATRIAAPDRDASATRVWLILWKAARAVEQNAIHSVAGLGLCLSDFAVLEALLHKGPQPVNAIGRAVLLTSGSITSAIDRLELRKLLRRAVDPCDSRSRIVHLTSAGRALIAKTFQKHACDMEETLAVLRPSERLELVRLLKKAGMWAAARLGEHRAPPHNTSKKTLDSAP